MSKELKPYQQRVVIEKKELDDKIEKLTAFIAGEVFKTLPSDECSRLTRQRVAMLDYSQCLEARIKAF
jgi:hypothetical protein